MYIMNSYDQFISKLSSQTNKKTIKWQKLRNKDVPNFVLDKNQVVQCFYLDFSLDKSIYLIVHKKNIYFEDIEAEREMYIISLYITDENDELDKMITHDQVRHSILLDLLELVQSQATHFDDAINQFIGSK